MLWIARSSFVSGSCHEPQSRKRTNEYGALIMVWIHSSIGRHAAEYVSIVVISPKNLAIRVLALEIPMEHSVQQNGVCSKSKQIPKKGSLEWQ